MAAVNPPGFGEHVLDWLHEGYPQGHEAYITTYDNNHNG